MTGQSAGQADLDMAVTDSGVARIVINRPERRNALTASMLTGLFDMFRDLGARDDVGAVVLTGVPGSFCSGVDVHDLRGRAGTGRGILPEEPTRAVRWPIYACEKPVIAAMDGPAVGLGIELAVQCDLRLMSPSARCSWGFVKLGLVADLGASTYLLPRQIGLPSALDLLCSGRFLDAQEAERIGFATLVEGDLDETAMTLAEGYARLPRQAVAATKRLVLSGLQSTPEAHLVDSLAELKRRRLSDEHRAAMTAVVERTEKPR